MRLRLTVLIGLTGRGSRIGVADNGPVQGIGGSDAGSPAGRDRREYLHRQGKHDDRKEFP
jgi:hypothetical protein